ncbi:MAG: type I-E CRISPR-associated protein Cse2/CasB [Eubacteriaceae bacterium]|jgi:CRISPR type I-E-associated protein CasB/Cse2|nr:type I-E CRISPR-associated protein Cse2/CasB [Eubacteriaceae bacterium]
MRKVNNQDAAKAVYSAVVSTIDKLAKRERGELSPYAATTLARLRQCAGRTFDECPEIWDTVRSQIKSKLSVFQQQCAENAVFVALALYSIHQRGKDKNVNIKKVGFGRAVRQVKVPDIQYRFTSFASSDSFSDLIVHARSLIELMRMGDARFDYANFAVDLFWFQADPDSRVRIRLGWENSFLSNSIN